MSNVGLILVSLGYLTLLFSIAYWAEQRKRQGKSVIHNGYVYALSMAVYCTAWTYYGSVGRAAVRGIDFVAIYLGPTLVAALFWPILRKMIRIAKTQRINSIADFISTRYGKNFSIAIVVTLFCVAGIIPYIALQIKAIAESFDIMHAGRAAVIDSSTNWFFNDTAFYSTALIGFFIILYGTRSVDASEKHEGLVAAIAFESVIKLVAFLAVGAFVVWGLFDGPADLFEQASQQPQNASLFTLQGGASGYLGWTAMIVLSMFAILLLPRQFQVQVVENTSEQHVNKAIWIFPLYLFLISLFVLPIALAGNLIFAETGTSADHYVLALPLQADKPLLALLTYIGGFSAATSMMIVSTIALSIMLSNNLIMPALLSLPAFRNAVDTSIQKTILYIRRFSIIGVLMLAYFYDKWIAHQQSLVSIGLVSFAAVAQFAPAVLGGMYWKQASKNGALWGIIAGFMIWFFTLVVPSMVSGDILDTTVLTDGLFGWSWLKPFHLFGDSGMDYITHSLFWSLLLNTGLFCLISLYDKRNAQEVYQAELFVDINRFAGVQEQASTWRGTAYLPDLKTLLANFLGKDRAESILQGYARRNQIQLDQKQADPRLVSFSERVLSGVIGSAAARTMVQSVTKEEEVSMDEVLNILRENQQMIGMNKELRRKSQELERATRELTRANEQLRSLDEVKDEFLYTVTHELRTPLTSIRALSEIVFDNPDLPIEQQQEYLGAVIRETERLSHLITQVLNLEKYESGRQKLHLNAIDMGEVWRHTAEAAQPLLREKNLTLHWHLPNTMMLLTADEYLIRQVAYNLLSNAIKFAQHDIHVRATHNYDEWQFTVEDDGRGIPEEELVLIFDKFFQAKNQTLQKPEGSGLGLAICRKIMDMHEGRIWAENRPEGGARFIFTLRTDRN
jgi:Na+/proline symporter/nitrogen-specific signal transduction histidine kinase